LYYREEVSMPTI
jgi:hypothetical protein